jgi:glycosyltransferase involved in cell wall biosynthesis
MNKNTFFISCPIDCYSGYSSRSRDLVKAIIESDKYDVKIIPQRWGDTSWGFIDDNPEWSFLKDYIYPHPNLQEQPDIWMQITVPNEFIPLGKFNIGCTAGMETTLVDGSWVEGVNRMDLTLVSSKHSKTSFMNSIYQKQNVGEIKVNKPIEVLFEGCDTDIYKVLDKLPNIDLVKDLNSIQESFCYLYVGHWLKGDFGEDRKNTSLLVKLFLETFKNKTKKPALILKTSQGTSSYISKHQILNIIDAIKESTNSNNLPNIYLLHGEFSDEEMNVLYNHPKVKAMVNLTKGEGFGRPLLEFSLVKKPIITTNWSGHLDFLNPDYTILLPGTLTKVHPSAVVPNMILPESSWFTVNNGSAAYYLKDVFENYKNYEINAKRQARHSKENFTWEHMSTKLESILDKYIPDLPKKIELKLPSLPKLELPKLNIKKNDA